MHYGEERIRKLVNHIADTLKRALVDGQLSIARQWSPGRSIGLLLIIKWR
jgi:hypothetical protein